MAEIEPNYGIYHVREWTEMKPPRREGYTAEGFPQCSEGILPRFLVFPYIGLVENILIPLNQEGMRPLEVRVIFMDKIQSIDSSTGS